MKIISSYDGSINLPWEPGLLEWLHVHYPYSKYRIVEVEYEV
jgi:hypothetical protein